MGPGRNMAPFVETEWGAEAYQIMRQLKSLADPTGLLNPGVIINSDPHAHLRDLKQLAHGRAGDRQVHRVRLLRAALPQPRPHAYPAPAHRGPARNGAPAATGRQRVIQPAGPRFSLHGARYLRRRRTVRHHLPGQH